MSPSPDVNRQIETWDDLLRETGSATIEDLEEWLYNWTDCDCLIDREDDQVIVVLDDWGIGNRYPFRLLDLWESVTDLERQVAEREKERELEQRDSDSDIVFE